MRRDRPSDLPQDILDFISRIERWTSPESGTADMRNIIVHDYTGIDTTIVQLTIKQWLPELRAAIEVILRRLSQS